MPIRNMGTLLENVVLVEAFRLLAINQDGNNPIDFFNSFAMPPLSDWQNNAVNACFSGAQLQVLQAAGQPATNHSYQGMMWACLQQPANQPGTQGPNGALLCALLAHHMNRPIRMWLNDIPIGHYGNAIPALARISTSVQTILGLAIAPTNQVITCDHPFPSSLIPPAQNNLTNILNMWGNNAHARLGFLDPMRYRINNANANETDSINHQHWLSLLINGFKNPVMSVHFTGNRNWPQLRNEINAMHDDCINTGYLHSVIANYAHYHVVTCIYHPNGQPATHQLALDLCHAIRQAWNNWCNTINHAPCALNTCIR